MSKRGSAQPRRWTQMFHVKHSDTSKALAELGLDPDTEVAEPTAPDMEPDAADSVVVEDTTLPEEPTSENPEPEGDAVVSGEESTETVGAVEPAESEGAVEETAEDVVGGSAEEAAEDADSAAGGLAEEADNASGADTTAAADEADEETTTTAERDEGADDAANAQGETAAETDDDSTPLARELTEITRRRRLLASQELPLPTSTRIFTVANQKGGVGKTTSTVNLAAALARQGARVLVIDLDPQGNASTALGVEHRSETVSVYDVIINDEPMTTAVQKSPEFEALFCLPATIHLAGAEIELVSLVAREQRLHTALETFLAESEEPFHYVFIDCPPSLGLLTINAFVAANEVLIPIQCEYYALEGLSQLLTNIQLIERHLNPKLAVSTILLTMFDSRTNLANQVAQEVRDHFPEQVLSTLIPRSVRISEAPSYGQSVISYDSNSSGSLSYLEAAAEIARRGVPT